MLRHGPLTSIIIPVYNGQQWIGRSLASASAQTYRDIEIVVVDDGSTDETGTIVEAAKAQDQRIRFFHKQHSGVSDSRNFGLAQARGSLIAPLDADDLWHPEKLSKQVALLQDSSPRVGLVYCWSVEIDKDDRIIPPIRSGSTAKGDVIAELIANVGIMDSGSIPLLRRSCLEAVGGYDPDPQSVEELWKLSLALAQICEFEVVPEHLVGYRRSTASNSRKVDLMDRSLRRVSDWVLRTWPDVPRNIKRQMIYHQNSYLAHQSLTNNDLLKALRYRVAACKARPAAICERQTIVFAARITARLLGISRSAWPLRKKPILFADLKPSQNV